jgi:hypothetical protein
LLSSGDLGCTPFFVGQQARANHHPFGNRPLSWSLPFSPRVVRASPLPDAVETRPPPEGHDHSSSVALAPSPRASCMTVQSNDYAQVSVRSLHTPLTCGLHPSRTRDPPTMVLRSLGSERAPRLREGSRFLAQFCAQTSRHRFLTFARMPRGFCGSRFQRPPLHQGTLLHNGALVLVQKDL